MHELYVQPISNIFLKHLLKCITFAMDMAALYINNTETLAGQKIVVDT